MNKKQLLTTGLAAGMAGLLAVNASADLISGWGLDTGQQNATLTEGVPGSFSVTTPTGNAGPRASGFSYDFSTVGVSLDLSGTVALANAPGNIQFRFGLFNLNGNSPGTLSGGLWSGASTGNWLGYLASPRNVADASGAAVLWGRNGTGGNAWLSSGATYSPTGNPGETFSGTGVGNGTFNFDLTLTRLAADQVGISWSFIETDGTGHFSDGGSYIDTAGLSSGVASFNAVGFLLNANTGAAQFSNVQITPIPEPATCSLIGLGLLSSILALRRRLS